MSSATSPIGPAMPARTSSGGSDDLSTDPADPLYTRFKSIPLYSPPNTSLADDGLAWRGVISNLIEYFEQLESYQKTKSKECTKLSKTLEVPFKTPEFASDGIATIWQAAKDKAVQMANFHSEEANLLKAGPIADLTRLRGDLKKHLSDLDKDGLQGSKKVGKKMDKFSDQTQSLGKWIPVAETNPTALDADHDPYVLWRQIRQKLYRAVDEENVLNEHLLALQTRCQRYEVVILQTIQKAFKDYTYSVSKESQHSLTVANELNSIAMQVPPSREWESFANREPSLLKPDHKPIDPLKVTFPFSDHKLTKPIIEGPLARKSTMLKRTTTSYYVLSPSGFLLEYKDKDPITNPEPTLSLKLCDCDMGHPPSRSGKAGFTIRGKDAGKSFGGRTHEYVFRADSMEQASTWWTRLEKFMGNAPRTEKITTSTMTDSEGEESPVSEKQPFNGGAAPGQKVQTAIKTEVPQTTEAVAQQPTTAAPQRTVSQKVPTTTTVGPAPTAQPTSPVATTIADPAPTTTTPPAVAAAQAATHTHPTNQSTA